MKKFILLTILFATTGLFAAGVQTVQYVRETALDNESVVLEGTFISQIDDDSFIFRDSTGTVKVEVSIKKTFIEPTIQGLHRLDGATVKIKAVVDKEAFEQAELEAVRIKVIKLAPDDF